MKRRFASTAGSAAFLLLAASPAPGAAIDWDRPANIKDAATRLAKMHRVQGSPGVLKFLDACYRTHMLASEFNAGLEGCLAQDYMHSQVLARIYARVPPETRAKNKNPSAEDIANGLGERFVIAFSQYKLAAADVKTFKDLVEQYGMPVFLKGAFPKLGKPPLAPDKPGGKN